MDKEAYLKLLISHFVFYVSICPPPIDPLRRPADYNLLCLMESRRATCGPSTLKPPSHSRTHLLMSSSYVLPFFSSNLLSPSSLRHLQLLVLIMAVLFLTPHCPLNAFLSSFIMSLFSPHPLPLLFSLQCAEVSVLFTWISTAYFHLRTHINLPPCALLSLFPSLSESHMSLHYNKLIPALSHSSIHKVTTMQWRKSLLGLLLEERNKYHRVSVLKA